MDQRTTASMNTIASESATASHQTPTSPRTPHAPRGFRSFAQAHKLQQGQDSAAGMECAEDAVDGGFKRPCRTQPYEAAGVAVKSAPMSASGRLVFRAHQGVYQSSCFKGSDTVYAPITTDLVVNTHRYDEISLGQGRAFLCDESGKYMETKEAMHICNLLRFTADGLQVLRSFVFTDPFLFSKIRVQLSL
eukprot:m.35631 g.35631  ORF g.35631 m.35631 type:complete len:191 (-) comp9907_c0_seq2:288-860(-)